MALRVGGQHAGPAHALHAPVIVEPDAARDAPLLDAARQGLRALWSQIQIPPRLRAPVGDAAGGWQELRWGGRVLSLPGGGEARGEGRQKG